jgi:hypothetical protein
MITFLIDFDIGIFIGEKHLDWTSDTFSRTHWNDVAGKIYKKAA